MGKVIEKEKVSNVFDQSRCTEVAAVIDTGATMFVLPQSLVEELGLRKIREAKVKYANGKVESKWVYGAVNIELKGRVGIFEVLAEENEAQPLIGQIILEALDLVVDPRTRTLIPNPKSPETPMVEILMARRIMWTYGSASLRPSRFLRERIRMSATVKRHFA